MEHGARIRPIGAESSDLVSAVLDAYPFKDYRRYASVGGKLARRHLVGSVLEAMAAPGAEAWLSDRADEPDGFALLSPLPWETAFFGKSMGRLSVFVTAGADRTFAVASALIEAAERRARSAGLEHLSTRLDVEDIRVLHAFEKHGFRLMDSLFTYAFHPRRNRLPDIERSYLVRPYEGRDEPAVMDVTATAFEDYPSRFSVDPGIPPEKSRAFYREWARKCCSGDLADAMLVAERRGRVIGYLAWRTNRELERHTGVRIEGGGLGACYPQRFNAYLELLFAATEIAVARSDASDCETHSFNMATANFYQMLDFRYVRAKYALHCWL